jgi:predicted signal transduction protein with EAL and GGDEF domain
MELVPFAGEGEQASHWVVVGRDITERRNAADAIHRLAFYDVLTGLPNRRLLMERLDAMVGQARPAAASAPCCTSTSTTSRRSTTPAATPPATRCWCTPPQRLSGALRQRDIVARIGGDEFVVLLDGLDADGAAATRAAQAVADKIRAPWPSRSRSTASLSHLGQHRRRPAAARERSDAQDLLREADTAMYHAKAEGRNGVALFEAAMLADAQRKLTLERDLAQAMENGELAMHLQLQVDHDGQPAGAELLMRWQRADGSFVPPDVFIPVAESSGLIVRWAAGCCARPAAHGCAGRRRPRAAAVDQRQPAAVPPAGLRGPGARGPAGDRRAAAAADLRSDRRAAGRRTSARPSAACASWPRSASASRSTISAPAIRTWPT